MNSNEIRAKVAACRHPGTVPLLTECGRYVEAERCTECPATWWNQIPEGATEEEKRKYAAWLDSTAPVKGAEK